MDRGRSAERVSQEIVRLSHAGLDTRTFGIEAVKHLRKAIPTDVSFFATADPATLLFTSAVRDEVGHGCTQQCFHRLLLEEASLCLLHEAGVESQPQLGYLHGIALCQRLA